MILPPLVFPASTYLFERERERERQTERERERDRDRERDRQRDRNRERETERTKLALLHEGKMNNTLTSTQVKLIGEGVST
jgi:hypothetical protein